MNADGEANFGDDAINAIAPEVSSQDERCLKGVV
jgi:hypothetical protein